MINWSEFKASERYFIETGEDFYRLSPTEQRKLMEAELERNIEGNLSPVPGNNSWSRGFDIT